MDLWISDVIRDHRVEWRDHRSEFKQTFFFLFFKIAPFLSPGETNMLQ